MITRKEVGQIAGVLAQKLIEAADIKVIPPSPTDVVFHFSERVKGEYPFPVVVDFPRPWPWELEQPKEGAD